MLKGGRTLDSDGGDTLVDGVKRVLCIPRQKELRIIDRRRDYHRQRLLELPTYQSAPASRYITVSNSVPSSGGTSSAYLGENVVNEKLYAMMSEFANK